MPASFLPRKRALDQVLMTQPQPKEPIYDNKGQLDRITPYLLSGETLAAVYDCKGSGTGFIGITDRRVIFYDQGVVHKKRSMVSIPYHQVVAVASTDEGFVLPSSEVILITAAGKFSFEFRGAEKGHWVYRYIMNQILAQTQAQLVHQ
jgi:hypothetical protein